MHIIGEIPQVNLVIIFYAHPPMQYLQDVLPRVQCDGA